MGLKEEGVIHSFDLLDCVSDKILILDREGYVVFINDTGIKFTGIDPDNYKKLHINHIFTIQDNKLSFNVVLKEAFLEKSLPGKIPVRNNMDSKLLFLDGKKFLTNPPEGNISYLMMIIQPIFQARKENLESLLSNVPGGIFQYRFFPDGTFKNEFMSKGAETIFELPLAKIQDPENFYQIIHPEDRDRYKQSINKGFADLSSWFIEVRLLLGNRIKWIRGLATSQKEDDNTVLWNGVWMDITAEKTARINLELSRERYRTLSISASEMLQLESLDEIYDYIIHSLRNQYPDTAILLALLDEDGEKAKVIRNVGIPGNYFQEMMKIIGYDIFKATYKVPKEYALKFKTGKMMNFQKGFADFVGNAFPVFIAKTLEKLINVPVIQGIGINQGPKLLGIVYFFSQDMEFSADAAYLESFMKQGAIILERKMIEIDLKESEEKFRSLVSAASDGISLTDENLKIIYVNDAFTKITGYPVKEILNQFLWEKEYMMIQPHVKQPARKKDIIQNLVNSFSDTSNDSNQKMSEYQITSKDGTKKTVQTRHFMIKTGKGTRFGSLMRDITKQKEYEKMLAGMNKTKDKLLSIIGHDLKNPMGNVAGFADLLARRYYQLTDDKKLEYIHLIRNSVHSLEELLDNLLLWSRAQGKDISIEPKVINIYHLVNDIIVLMHSMQENKKVIVYNEMPENMEVYADKEMIRTVLRNLFFNALKYSPENGEIKITGTREENMVVIGVIDHGVGLSEDQLTNLFESHEFNSTRGTFGEKGTGLGLKICREFVESNGGQIWAENGTNKGAAFYLTLPAKNPR
ncbi:MAG: ATP-binding protein [Bacteroidota bacterium]